MEKDSKHRMYILLIFVVVAWLLHSYIGSKVLIFAAFLISVPLISPNTTYVFLNTYKRDFRALSRYVKLRWRIRKTLVRDVGVPTVFQEVCAKNPDKIAFYFEDESWTFRKLDEYSNRIANYFKSCGVKHGHCIGLFMENRIEYVGIWLGLSKLGAVPALLNYNLRLTSLGHCLRIVNADRIICSAQDQSVIKDALVDDLKDIKVYVQGVSEKESLSISGAQDLDVGISNSSTDTPPEILNVKFADKLVYIYTSGTTGMPKAAVIKHSRAFFASHGMASLIGTIPTDVVYNPLPLYHTVGGVIGVGMCLFDGNSLAIRKKFSASNFWKDCDKYKCTVAQYIGEICRYLLNTPEKPTDTQHQVRLMFGNGLRPQIWPQFQSRFKIDRISEFYGSTEGNANIINMDGHEGAIGFVSVIVPGVYPVTLIRMDEDGVPIRDKNGVCIRCKPGEPGEFVGRIVSNDPVRDFDGYADKKATATKIVENVWKKGDKAFLSGDILVMDDFGYLYFKDRRGDTFRWRGENVSTTEVEGVVSSLVEKRDVVVFGVEVPGVEGRAGMACILDAEHKVSVEDVASGVVNQLPSYARPLFIRRLTELDLTGTFKVKKVALKAEGFDPNKIKDDLFFFDAAKASYVPLDINLHEDICSGRIRL